LIRQLAFCSALFTFGSLLNTANAVTIILYDNGAPNQASADSISDTLVAEDFNLFSSASLLTALEFWDVEGGGAYNGSINWFIYNNGAGTPGASILAQGSASSAGQITRTSTGNTCCGGFAEFNDVINLSASRTAGTLTLGSGTYWIAVHDGDISNTTFQDFYWETTANNATTFGQAQDLTVTSPPWTSTLQEHAFNISADVPEPSTWAFIGMGLASLALLRRKKT
jgi:hypothetical protein